MAETAEKPQFQAVVEAVEALSLEDQAVLVDVIHKRLAEKEREQLIADVAEARAAYRNGAVKHGSAADLLKELGE